MLQCNTNMLQCNTNTMKITTTEKILQLIINNPGISTGSIAEKMQISRITAYRHTKELLKIQKIRKEGQGKSQRYFGNLIHYVNARIPKQFSPSEIEVLKNEIIAAFLERYDEDIEWDNVEYELQKYFMKISRDDDTIFTGFEGFLLFCAENKLENRIIEKLQEYLDIIGSIEYLRKKNGFFDGKQAAIYNLEKYMKIGFDHFYFCMPSVIKNGYGSTRPAFELRYGKKNSNDFLMSESIKHHIDTIRNFVNKNRVDACIFTPPTVSRILQFREVIKKHLDLKIREIKAEKTPPFGKILEEQKDIKEKKRRVLNATQSLQMDIPKEIHQYKHIVIFDDSFTTGATPNAIAMRLRENNYMGIITIITICGSFDYELAISEDEI